MHGGRGAEWSTVKGGRFSLGRLRNGSGYCVGSVVETRMGIKEERDEMMGGTRTELRTSVQRGRMGGSGMRDVWVMGEGFFRGVGAVFDVSPSRLLGTTESCLRLYHTVARAKGRISHILEEWYPLLYDHSI